MSGAVDTLIAELDGFRGSANPQPVIATIFNIVAALQQLNGQGSFSSVAVIAPATLDATFNGKTVRADATAGAFAIGLNPAAADGDFLYIRKNDASANRVTVQFSGADLAWLSAQNDCAMFVFVNGSWKAQAWSIAPILDVFTGSGTWTKPPNAQFINVVLFAGGNGGGSGRRGAAASVRTGGTGGAGGSIVEREFQASICGATESVTVGAGGTGGAAQAVDSTDGNPGNVGGVSQFGGATIHAQASNPSTAVGVAGTTTAQPGPSNLVNSNYGSPAPGGASTAAAIATSPANGITGGGGAGGSIDAGNTNRGGANGSSGSVITSPNAGGNNGTAGNNGQPGTAAPDSINNEGGGGGGGGGMSQVAAGGAGGAGGAPAGGGGGGGATLNGFTSGAGGAGARGEVRIWSVF